jgi:polar amino acid transport system ATP-binding protein/general L-amino acid transport system ATP-binding protein
MSQSSAGPTPLIRLEAVSKSFGQFKALDQVDLSVASGEKIVICGPSGSGKSTLIRCLSQLEHHDGGQIWVDGVEVGSEASRQTQARSEIGMVFQQFNLFPHLSVIDNLMLAPMRVRGLAPEQARELAMQYLERVDIVEQADKFPGQLSGGQQQRVAIARSLCMRPRILLFDEPTSALDPEMIQEVLGVMEGLAREGMTMLCVTHEMGFARRVADRVVFMDQGRVVEEAPPQTFFSAPRSERCRSFLERILHH